MNTPIAAEIGPGSTRKIGRIGARGFAWIAVMAALAASSGAWAAAPQGQLIVKYKPGVFRARTLMRKLYAHLRVRRVRRYAGMMKGFEQLILSDGASTEGALKVLRESGVVEYAQPNYILKILPLDSEPGARHHAATPCVPGFEWPGCDPHECIFPWVDFPAGCHYSNGSRPGASVRPPLRDAPQEVSPPVADPYLDRDYGLSRIEAPEAWKETLGSKDIIVADIDTGIDYNHEDLAFNVWRNPHPSEKQDVVGYDFIHDDGLPFDDHYHGTHTAGTIGAVGGNGKGISGVSPRVSIMALKFISSDNYGTTADAIRAIDYAIGHGARVLNNSWGGKADDTNPALYEAIERARAKGVLFIAAAGNDGADNDALGSKDAIYPASFNNDNLIAVAATDGGDELAPFSNYGIKSTHLAAPGVKIYSTEPGNRYGQRTGTSMACPHVAGAAALVWSKHPDWNYRQVKKALLDSVDLLPSLQGKVSSGGRLNVLKALSSTE